MPASVSCVDAEAVHASTMRVPSQCKRLRIAMGSPSHHSQVTIEGEAQLVPSGSALKRRGVSTALRGALETKELQVTQVGIQAVVDDLALGVTHDVIALAAFG